MSSDGEERCEAFLSDNNTPFDFDKPDWDVCDKVHNWKNYVSKNLKAEWKCFSTRQKIILSGSFNDIADNEVWD